jgi:hypothetical protein
MEKRSVARSKKVYVTLARGLDRGSRPRPVTRVLPPNLFHTSPDQDIHFSLSGSTRPFYS